MRRRLSGALVAAVALLAGCAAPPALGTVVDRSHTEGYYYVQQVQCGSTGGRYPSPIFCPQTLYMPPSWSVQVVPSGSGEDAVWVSVEEGLWETCAVGARWRYDEATEAKSCDWR